MTRLRSMWRRFLASWRLSESAVCEESAKLGPYDYHDYPNSVEGTPDHMVLLTCARCGKKFYI